MEQLPEVSPTKGDVAEEPVLFGDLVFADLDEVVPQELAHPELLGAAPDEYSEKEVPTDASLDVEVAPPAAVESESADRVENLDQKALISVIPVETLEDEAQEDAGEEEAGNKLLTLPEVDAEVEADASYNLLPETPEAEDWKETDPEESAVIVLDDQEPETTHLVSSDALEEEDKAVDLMVLDEDTEDDLIDAELEEESYHLFLTFDDQVEHFAESEPEDPAVTIPLDSERESEETIFLDHPSEAPGRHTGAAGTVAPAGLTMEELTGEDSILIVIPLEDQSEDLEVQSDPVPEEPALDDAAPPDDQLDDRYPDILMDPAEKVPAAETSPGATQQSITPPAPAAPEAEGETAPSSVEGVTFSGGFEAAGVLTGDESAGNKSLHRLPKGEKDKP